MTRRAIAIVALVAGLAAAVWWWTGRSQEPDSWLGYVEGESIDIASPVAGTLARLSVERGTMARAGQPLFALDPATQDAEVARLAAQVTAAQAQYDDLRQARQRPAELGVARAQQDAARAELVRATKEQARFEKLAADGFATRARLDAARATTRAARAALDQARASEASGRLAGRQDQIEAAAATVRAAQAALAQAKRRGAEIAPVAPVSALVEQTYYNAGEWVTANVPVVRLLEPGRVKIRFFVPEGAVSSVRPGSRVALSCDGCGAPIDATVRFVASRAEFTPPVIYSERARAKLVFLVEASPDRLDPRLRPGLPVDVVPR